MNKPDFKTLSHGQALNATTLSWLAVEADAEISHEILDAAAGAAGEIVEATRKIAEAAKVAAAKVAAAKVAAEVAVKNPTEHDDRVAAEVAAAKVAEAAAAAEVFLKATAEAAAIAHEAAAIIAKVALKIAAAKAARIVSTEAVSGAVTQANRVGTLPT